MVRVPLGRSVAPGAGRRDASQVSGRDAFSLGDTLTTETNKSLIRRHGDVSHLGERVRRPLVFSRRSLATASMEPSFENWEVS